MPGGGFLAAGPPSICTHSHHVCMCVCHWSFWVGCVGLQWAVSNAQCGRGVLWQATLLDLSLQGFCGRTLCACVCAPPRNNQRSPVRVFPLAAVPQGKACSFKAATTSRHVCTKAAPMRLVYLVCLVCLTVARAPVHGLCTACCWPGGFPFERHASGV